MKRVINYREQASACRDLARKMPPAHQQQLLDMARQWDEIADERERGLKTGEWPKSEV